MFRQVENMRVLTWHNHDYMHISWKVIKIHCMLAHSPMIFRMIK